MIINEKSANAVLRNQISTTLDFICFHSNYRIKNELFINLIYVKINFALDSGVAQKAFVWRLAFNCAFAIRRNRRQIKTESLFKFNSIITSLSSSRIFLIESVKCRMPQWIKKRFNEIWESSGERKDLCLECAPLETRQILEAKYFLMYDNELAMFPISQGPHMLHVHMRKIILRGFSLKIARRN